MPWDILKEAAGRYFSSPHLSLAAAGFFLLLQLWILVYDVSLAMLAARATAMAGEVTSPEANLLQVALTAVMLYVAAYLAGNFSLTTTHIISSRLQGTASFLVYLYSRFRRRAISRDSIAARTDRRGAILGPELLRHTFYLITGWPALGKSAEQVQWENLVTIFGEDDVREVLRCHHIEVGTWPLPYQGIRLWHPYCRAWLIRSGIDAHTLGLESNPTFRLSFVPPVLLMPLTALELGAGGTSALLVLLVSIWLAAGMYVGETRRQRMSAALSFSHFIAANLMPLGKA